MLTKYLLQEASAEEQKNVEDWLLTDPANSNYLNDLRTTWALSSQLHFPPSVDENLAWQKFKARLRERPAAKPHGYFQRWRKWTTAAAAILIIVCSSLIALQFIKNGRPEQITMTSTEKVLNDSLPDGSAITLNKNTSLAYHSSSKTGKREVLLKGEAFFNVRKDATRPFEIKVNDINITVIGTSFNVKESDKITEVVVESGVVRVTRKTESIELKAGEKLLVHADSLLLKRAVQDNLYNYYRTKEFVCDDTPLWKLVEILNQAYGSNIKIGRNGLKNLLLNATFVNESLDQVLAVISLTFNIKVIRNPGNEIILE